ncbi:hypothetical protein BVY03_01570 [bacterium K02(2017)]|nr:hypothetical protein BVY03_01570 [bacterium K02(2017)]
MLENLFNKRLVLISGKGGVGKTSVCVLLALLAAKLKKNTLIVEMNSTGNITPIFNTSVSSQKEIPIAPYISSINLSPQVCFEEYVLKHIRLKTIYKTFFNNKFVSNFLNAVPGLNEILMLGKIYELEKLQKKTLKSEPAYDLIIIDAPATGHNLSALEVPNILKSAIKIGPLHHHAASILDLLGNHDKTIFSLVTLAEEMPVNESFEYVATLKEKTNLNFGPLFINSVMPEIVAVKKNKNTPENLIDCWNYYQLTYKRSLLNQYYIDDIHNKFPNLEKITLPFQFKDLDNVKDFSNLLSSLKEQLH